MIKTGSRQEQHKHSILLVGKPGHLRDALAGLLESMPAIGQVTYADSSLLALQTIRKSQPDLVLAAGQPDSEYPELIRVIKQRLPHTRSLALVEMPTQQSQVLYAGADCIMPGGITAQQLLTTIENLLLKEIQ